MNPIFRAVLRDDAAALSAWLTRDPGMAAAVMGEDRFIASIPHWLYVGDTPLHLAAAGLRFEAARALLEAGAGVNAENRRGATPLHYACDPRPKSGGTWNPAKQAKMIDLLARHGAALDHGDKGGATALHRAVRARSPRAVEALLRAGARMDVRLRKKGSTPLHLATQSTGAGGTAGAIEERIEIIGLLLRHGADPTMADSQGKTALDWARNQNARAILEKHRG